MLDRNLKEYDIYCADVGQRKYIEANARKGANNKVACDSEYLLFIRDKVKQHYSFYSANELAKQEGFNTRVCLTTLYNYFNKHFIKLKKSDMPYNKIKKVKQEKETKRVYQYGKRSIDERVILVVSFVQIKQVYSLFSSSVLVRYPFPNVRIYRAVVNFLFHLWNACRTGKRALFLFPV